MKRMVVFTLLLLPCAPMCGGKNASHTRQEPSEKAMLLCAICQDALRSEREALPCGHMFCRDCVAQGREHGMTKCPICRHSIAEGYAPPVEHERCAGPARAVRNNPSVHAPAEHPVLFVDIHHDPHGTSYIVNQVPTPEDDEETFTRRARYEAVRNLVEHTDSLSHNPNLFLRRDKQRRCTIL